MRILITGIDGFIGKHLAKALAENGHQVKGLDRGSGGVLNKKLVGKSVGNSEIIIHLAALTSHKDIIENKFETLETNLQGTKNVLDAFSKSKKTRKFLYASSGKVYGRLNKLPISETHPTNPLNILGKSKLIAEKLIDFYANDTSTSLSASQKEFIIFRIFNVYGPLQDKNFLIPTIIKQLGKGKSQLTLGDIGAKRDYLYIDDLVNAFVLAIEKKEKTGISIYNVCSGKATSARQIVKIISKIKGRSIKIKTNPNLYRRDEAKVEYGSYKLIQKTLGWKPKVSLQEGLKKMITK